MQNRDDFQKHFVAGVTTGKREDKLLDQIEAVGGLTPAEVLDVYQRDYRARLTEAIGESLETTWAVLGDSTFFELVESYLREFPSSHQDLSQVAAHMPIFLKNHALLADYPFLIDLVTFELSFWRTFHLESLKVNNNEIRITPEELLQSKIIIIDGVELFNWDVGIYSIWKLREEGFANHSLEEFERSQCLLLFKGKYQVQAIELSRSQYVVLKGFQRRLTLEEILEEETIEPPELQQLFAILQQNHLIAMTIK